MECSKYYLVRRPADGVSDEVVLFDATNPTHKAMLAARTHTLTAHADLWVQLSGLNDEGGAAAPENVADGGSVQPKPNETQDDVLIVDVDQATEQQIEDVNGVPIDAGLFNNNALPSTKTRKAKAKKPNREEVLYFKMPAVKKSTQRKRASTSKGSHGKTSKSEGATPDLSASSSSTNSIYATPVGEANHNSTLTQPVNAEKLREALATVTTPDVSLHMEVATSGDPPVQAQDNAPSAVSGDEEPCAGFKPRINIQVAEWHERR